LSDSGQHRTPRGSDLHFKPEHFGVLAVAMVKHCHGKVLAERDRHGHSAAKG
jgi:hypothetical protein